MVYRIENWEVVGKIASAYSSPESATMHLKGEIYGHPKYNEGEIVVTSKIIETDGTFIKTFYHCYQLGYPHPRYEQWYLEKHGHKVNINAPFPLVKQELPAGELLLAYVRLITKYGQTSKEAKEFIENHNTHEDFTRLYPIVNYIEKKYDQRLNANKATHRRLIHANYGNVN